jgi:hypothetical protein
VLPGATTTLGRGAGGLGESAWKVGVEDGFQREAMKAAGCGAGGGDLRSSSGERRGGFLGQNKTVRRCAGSRRRGQRREGGQGLTEGVEFARRCSLSLQTPARNHGGLGALFVGEARGK